MEVGIINGQPNEEKPENHNDTGLYRSLITALNHGGA